MTTNPTKAENPSDPAAIAASLTKAQRELLMQGGNCVRIYKPAKALVGLGLWLDAGDEYTIKPRITALGEQVRAILAQRSTTNG